MSSQHQSWADKAIDRLVGDALAELSEMIRDGLAEIDAQAESPIERALGAKLLVSLRPGYGASTMPNMVDYQGRLGSTAAGTPSMVAGQIVIIPQFKIDRYRLDFMVFYAVSLPRDEPMPYEIMRYAVECDGHAFHERTPEQAQRDKSRDRHMTALGIQVFRFTGREIAADSDDLLQDLECAMTRDYERRNRIPPPKGAGL